MSKYGFDLDGTLTRPALAQLANDLFDAGHEVYVVTGGLADSGEWTVAAREELLSKLGVRYTSIIRCIDSQITRIGDLKGQECNRLGISIIFDDAPLYLAGMARTSTVQRLAVI